MNEELIQDYKQRLVNAYRAIGIQQTKLEQTIEFKTLQESKTVANMLQQKIYKLELENIGFECRTGHNLAYCNDRGNLDFTESAATDIFKYLIVLKQEIQIKDFVCNYQGIITWVTFADIDKSVYTKSVECANRNENGVLILGNGDTEQDAWQNAFKYFNLVQLVNNETLELECLEEIFLYFNIPKQQIATNPIALLQAAAVDGVQKIKERLEKWSK